MAAFSNRSKRSTSWLVRAVERVIDRHCAPGRLASAMPRFETMTSFGRIHSRQLRCSSGGEKHVPVVLVHGFGVSSLYLLPTASWLAADFDVYVPDLPGFGASERPRRALNLAQLADALHEWMQAVQVPRAALIGNSYGAQIVIETAIRHFQSVDRLALNGPAVDPQQRNFFKSLRSLLRDAPREARGLTRIVAYDYLRSGPLRLWRTYRNMINAQPELSLPQVTVPALVVCGADDPIAPRRWAEQVARLLPDGRLEIIPGAAHATVYSGARELTRVVRPFLLEGDSGSPAHHA
jgi:2-hydroxy-6-oxonona-2,4-dienedioate hydrolase